MNYVVLGLGSNIGFNGFTCVELLQKAVMQLKQIVNNLICSSVYRTKPMYVENQNDFYNMVVFGSVSNNLGPFSLLEHIHLIEATLGRKRSKELRFGPRSIDIDIEFFGDKEINTSDLQIPHPRLQERAFVLQPLLEILPEIADTLKGKKLKKIQSDFINLNSTDVEFFLDKEVFFNQVEKEVHNGNTITRSS